MALTIVVEDGSGKTDANSYASVDDGNAYHYSRLGSEAWQDTTVATRESVLVWATRLLDEQVIWKGSPANTDQALDWPRVGVHDKNGITLIDNDEVPQWLKDATAELGRHLIGRDRTAEDDTRGFRRIKAGELDLEVDKSDRVTILPRAVISIVKFYGLVAGGRTVRLVRA